MKKKISKTEGEFTSFDAASGRVLLTTTRFKADTKHMPGVVVEGIFPEGEYELVDGEVVAIEKPVPTITVYQIRQTARRYLSMTDWEVDEAQETGAFLSQTIIDERAAIRAVANDLISMNPIPADFQDPKYWPDAE